MEEFDVKWARMLESAAIIGSKFNADILSQVWGFELLEILGFLEAAEASIHVQKTRVAHLTSLRKRFNSLLK